MNEVRYLVASASPLYGLAGIENAIEGTADVLQSETSHSGRAVALIECADWRAEWLSGRLSSCLYGGNVVYKTRAEAECVYAMLLEI